MSAPRTGGLSRWLATAGAERDGLSMVPTLPLADQVDKVAQRLADDFAGAVPDRVVRRMVDEVYGEMASAKVTQFVPVLVDRGVRSRLRAQLRADLVTA
jgi:hypothetical protein